ncbi:MAG: DUF3467 domain-containing protein [Nanoarchaeota archaeon]|nr:DUF3467 domain-containing protein [Nanoarchaeota archaeon]
MEKEEKKVNMTIKDSAAFYAHEMSINFNPMNFILDFKNVTPRVDPRSKESLVLHLEHNVIIVDAFHAKKIYELLGKVLGDYEKEFGKIEMPKALKKYEDKMKKGEKEVKKAKTTSPSYFG